MLSHIAEWSKTENILSEDLKRHRLIEWWQIVTTVDRIAIIVNAIDLELSWIMRARCEFDGFRLTLLAVAGLLFLLEVLFAVVAVVPESFCLHQNIVIYCALYCSSAVINTF